MANRNGQPDQQPTPRAQAVQTAATAVNAHATAPDSVTFHTMQNTVQKALDLGATLHDIRDARTTA